MISHCVSMNVLVVTKSGASWYTRMRDVALKTLGCRQEKKMPRHVTTANTVTKTSAAIPMLKPVVKRSSEELGGDAGVFTFVY